MSLGDGVVHSVAELDEKAERHECAVCCEEVDPSRLLMLPCKHCYHGPCMNLWAEQHAGRQVTCPQCRAPVSQELLQELQRPLSWVDILVIPLMVTVMVFQALLGYLQTGYVNFKKGGVKLMTISGNAISSALGMVRLALAEIGSQSVLYARATFQMLKTGLLRCKTGGAKLMTFFGNVISSASATIKSHTLLLVRTVVQALQGMWFSIRRKTTPILAAICLYAYLWSWVVSEVLRDALRKRYGELVKFSVFLETVSLSAYKISMEAMQRVFNAFSSVARAVIQAAGLLWHHVNITATAISGCFSKHALKPLSLAMSTTLRFLEDTWKSMLRVVIMAWDYLKDKLHFACELLLQGLTFAGQCVRSKAELVARSLERLTRKAHHNIVVVGQYVVRQSSWNLRAAWICLEQMWHLCSRYLAARYANCRDHIYVVSNRTLVALRVASQTCSRAFVTVVVKMAAAWISAYKVSSAVSKSSITILLVRARGALRMARNTRDYIQKVTAPIYDCFREQVLDPVLNIMQTGLQACCRISTTVVRSMKTWSQTALQCALDLGLFAARAMSSTTRHAWQYSESLLASFCARIEGFLFSAWRLVSSAFSVAFQECFRALAQVFESVYPHVAAILLHLMHHFALALQGFAKVVGDGLLLLQQTMASCIRWIRYGAILITKVAFGLLRTKVFQPVVAFARLLMQFLWRALCILGTLVVEIFISIRMTVYNVVYRPRCSVCGRGCAKLRSLCFTCVGDHLVPRCSDCGRGWCKFQARCISCTIDHHFENPRCGDCKRGFKKIGLRCFTCAMDQVLSRCVACQRGYKKLGGLCFSCLMKQMIAYLSTPSRCAVCCQGYPKLGKLCFTCFFDQHVGRCCVCQRGFRKVGTRCFTCLFKHFMSSLRAYPRCAICCRGYQKVGTRCFTCYSDRFLSRCSVCRRGYAKIGTRCCTCLKAHVMEFPRCGICRIGSAKIGTRCFTCFKVHVTDFPRCGICQIGYAKFGVKCFKCYWEHLTNYPRCAICQEGYAKVGHRCFKCFRAHLANLRCSICQRGYAKIGSRCLTCHFALMRSGAPKKPFNANARDAKIVKTQIHNPVVETD